MENGPHVKLRGCRLGFTPKCHGDLSYLQLPRVFLTRGLFAGDISLSHYQTDKQSLSSPQFHIPIYNGPVIARIPASVRIPMRLQFRFQNNYTSWLIVTPERMKTITLLLFCFLFYFLSILATKYVHTSSMKSENTNNQQKKKKKQTNKKQKKPTNKQTSLRQSDLSLFLFLNEVEYQKLTRD